MRLVGYIKEQKKDSFAIPVYSGKEREFYFHTLNESYTITGFTAAQLNTTTFKKIYLSKKFDLGSKGAVVFIGKDGYIKYDGAENAIDEIINYINDNYTFVTAGTLVEEADSIQKNVFSDLEVKKNAANAESEYDPIILSFDFPTAEKEAVVIDLFPEKKQGKSKGKVELEQTADPAFKSAIKHLNAIEKNFEIMLKMRAEERRSKLKTFNYQFHFGQKNRRGLKPLE